MKVISRYEFAENKSLYTKHEEQSRARGNGVRARVKLSHWIANEMVKSAINVYCYYEYNFVVD